MLPCVRGTCGRPFANGLLTSHVGSQLTAIIYSFASLSTTTSNALAASQPNLSRHFARTDTLARRARRGGSGWETHPPTPLAAVAIDAAADRLDETQIVARDGDDAARNETIVALRRRAEMTETGVAW